MVKADLTLKWEGPPIDEVGDKMLEALDHALDDFIDLVGDEATKNLDTGEFQGDGFLKKGQDVIKDPGKKVISYDVRTLDGRNYACIVGRDSVVKLENGFKSISTVNKGDMVLSKDGVHHPVKKNIHELTVKDKPNLILLKHEKSRAKEGLMVTEDHLILTLRDSYMFWEHAKNLNIGNFVFKPIKNAWNKGNREETEQICKACSKPFKVETSSLDHRPCNYCSQECYHGSISHDHVKGKRWKLTLEQRKNKLGEKNSAWKGGTSKLPYGPTWNKILKSMVKERDGYTCQICNLNEKDSDWVFHVHHIDGNKFNNTLANLTLLCPSCHGKQQWQDAELVTIDLDLFEPVKLVKKSVISAKTYFKDRALDSVKLWDLAVDGENSFVAKGFLVHNSFVEFGTGIFSDFPGASKQPIRAKNSKALAWVTRGERPTTKEGWKEARRQGRAIIAKEIKGMKPRPFLRSAFESALKRWPELVAKNLSKISKN